MGERLSLPTEIKGPDAEHGHFPSDSYRSAYRSASLIMLFACTGVHIFSGRWIGCDLPLVAGLAKPSAMRLTGMQPPATAA